MVKYMGFVRDCLHEVDRKLETSPSKLSESTKKLSLIVPHCAEVEYAINIGRVQLTAIEYNIGWTLSIVMSQLSQYLSVTLVRTIHQYNYNFGPKLLQAI